MMLLWILRPLLALANWLIGLFPSADVAGVTSKFEGVGRVYSWICQLDQAFPIKSLIVAIGVVLTVWGGMYAVMVIRRVFSLVWPGAGS